MHLIRHFQTVEHGKFIGASDPSIDLSSLPEFLSPLCERIICSPKKRALESCKILFPTQQFEICPDFAEINYGLWEGLTWKEIERRWPLLAAQKMDSWLAVTTPQGEEWNSFVQRVTGALQSLGDQLESTAVIAHQGVNAIIHSLFTGSNPLTFKQGYGEIIEL